MLFILFFLVFLLVLFFSVFVAVFLLRRHMLFPTYGSRIFTAQRPSFTAELVCMYRAIGTELGMCNDPFAIRFCDLDAKLVCKLFLTIRKLFGRQVPLGNIAMLAVRTLSFDEYILNSGCEQVVILGAGLDARPYRLGGALLGDKVRFFEVDAPATQRMKKRKVKQVFETNPRAFTNPAYSTGRVIYVSCDFATESFLERLEVAGFDKSNPKTAILLEGVASYLTWDELKNTSLKVASCASGTLFAMNVRQDDMRETTTSRLLKSFVGEEWKFSMKLDETAETRFAPLGFKVLREKSFAQAMDENQIFKNEARSKLPGRMMFLEVR
jgi:methyltransferase (TIGR00027 family)